MNLKNYKVGDYVWIVLHWWIIKCRIVYISPKKDSSDIQFYWVDEPIGHAISEYEIFDTKYDALKDFYDFWNYDWDKKIKRVKLKDWRKRSIIRFKNQALKLNIPFKKPKYPKKRYDKDWFYL